MTDVQSRLDPDGLPPNPYVGPQALGPDDTIYGRHRELNELRDLLIARRIVLLYSPSGAGKSSLLEGGLGLRSELEAAHFEVLRTIRVSHVPEQGGEDPAAGSTDNRLRNRYVWSVLSSMEEGRGVRTDPTELASMTINDYLARRALQSDKKVSCLIFDQFEELFTLDSADYPVKEAFLDQLGEALRDDSRWAVFAMREDFIARLDPYASKIPTRLAARFRLDLLREQQAIEAATGPAQAAGVRFEKDAAKQLVRDLQKVKVEREPGFDYGPYVEPVQLQVVCRQLWTDVHRHWQAGGSGGAL